MILCVLSNLFRKYGNSFEKLFQTFKFNFDMPTYESYMDQKFHFIKQFCF